MKKLFTCLTFGVALFCSGGIFAGSIWNKVPLANAPSQKIQTFHPEHYLVYTFNEELLKLQMFSLSTDPIEGMVIELPMPDGTTKNFKVWQDPMMSGKLADKYADIKTFTGVLVGDQRVTAKLDFTVYGFHAMVFDGENTSFVDPYDMYHDGYYMVHYKKDEVRNLEQRMKCEFKDADETSPAGEAMATYNTGLPKLAARTGNGWTRKTYDLALSANHFYCQAATGIASPTMTQCMSVMTTTMNRVNGVYEREFSVHMNYTANEDTLIWPTNTGSINGSDPFNTINTNGPSCMGANQTACDNRIGSANYDCGHVFTTGGGGVSGLGIVCTGGQKARSVTGLPNPVGDGYDIDYVAHEMGHEFGSNHTFGNNNDGSCSGNRSSTHSYEPGSGTTIMAYAGICNPDDLAPHSEAYFHASSLLEITAKLVGSENVCATPVSTGNKLVSLAPFTATYKIPYKTPFELIAPTAVDSVADTATMYCWEQWNLNTATSTTSRLVNTFVKGPLFRSWFPLKIETRVFPKMSKVLTGVLSDAGTEGAQGEKVPDTARFLTFRLTVRNILSGNGCFLFPDDSIHLDAIQTTTKAGFKVTSQATTSIAYAAGSTQTITWNVVGTDVAPVSAANVTIYMSKDNGVTWPYTIGTFPNTGTASITVPNPGASTAATVCRFKVKGTGNVFFNVNQKGFQVTSTGSGTGITQPNALAELCKVYPVPTTDVLHISTGISNNVSAVIYNTIGQAIWSGTVNGQAEVSVASWAKGVYHIQLANAENGDMTVKSFIVQ